MMCECFTLSDARVIALAVFIAAPLGAIVGVTVVNFFDKEK